jgi:asparagine synthetase A
MIGKESVAGRLPELTVCLFVLLAGTGAAVAAEETVTLEGEIEAARYDGDEVAAVAVYDDQWDWVLVVNEGKGKELLNHVGAVVKVTGKIIEIDDDVADEYAHEIVVTSYTVEVRTESDAGEEWDPEE